MEAPGWYESYGSVIFLVATIIVASIGNYIYQKYLKKQPSKPVKPSNRAVRTKRRK